MKRFAPNAVFYYSMALPFFLYECFKEDVCATVVPIGAYATTFRRKVMDLGAKILRTAGKTILKVTTAIRRHLHIEELCWMVWATANNYNDAPAIAAVVPGVVGICRGRMRPRPGPTYCGERFVPKASYHGSRTTR